MTGGGCSCDNCGAIFVGHEWEDGLCAACRPTPTIAHPGVQVMISENNEHMVERVARAIYFANDRFTGDEEVAAKAALAACHYAELVETLTAVRAYYMLANPTKLTEAQVCDMVCGALDKIGAS
jgi:hypothetical protein